MKNTCYLFNGITPEDVKKLHNCLKVKVVNFEAGAEILQYGKVDGVLGVVTQGKVLIRKLNTDGNFTILDNVEKNEVFSKSFNFTSSNVNFISAYASEPTTILFFDYYSVFNHCEKSCNCHAVFVENLFKSLIEKSKSLSKRVVILSNKTIRDKILSYASIMVKNSSGNSFTLPMSLTSFAQYLCVDRSAMMRELKKLSDEGILKNNKRVITVYKKEYI